LKVEPGLTTTRPSGTAISTLTSSISVPPYVVSLHSLPVAKKKKIREITHRKEKKRKRKRKRKRKKKEKRKEKLRKRLTKEHLRAQET